MVSRFVMLVLVLSLLFSFWVKCFDRASLRSIHPPRAEASEFGVFTGFAESGEGKLALKAECG